MKKGSKKNNTKDNNKQNTNQINTQKERKEQEVQETPETQELQEEVNETSKVESETSEAENTGANEVNENKVADQVAEAANVVKERLSSSFGSLKDKAVNIEYKKYFDKAWGFVNKHRRYFLAGVLFIAFILLMAFGAGKDGFLSGSGDATASGNVGKFEKNKHEDVRALIENYYAAYAEGNMEELVQYAEPFSGNEAEYIAVFSQFVESYNVKNVYTQQGVEEGSYLVSVEMAIKFTDVETEAPGLDFFYVETGVEDKLYISNIYSQFNLQIKEFISDEEILAAISAYENRTEVKELQAKVQAEYEEAIASDEALSAMVTTTVGRAVSEWMATITIEQNQLPPEGALAKKDETQQDTTGDDSNTEGNTAGEGEDATQEPVQEILNVEVVEQVQTKEEVNMRAAADTGSTIVMTVPAGTILEVVSMDEWGSWTCVSLNGSTGYIRNDFLTTVATTYAVAGQPAYPSVGQSVVLSQDQNVMTRMANNAGIVANLKLGTTVTVDMCYANGWTKISWDGMAGYIPTAILKLD